MHVEAKYVCFHHQHHHHRRRRLHFGSSEKYSHTNEGECGTSKVYLECACRYVIHTHIMMNVFIESEIYTVMFMRCDTLSCS
jgi:hypothetical protein